MGKYTAELSFVVVCAFLKIDYFFGNKINVKTATQNGRNHSNNKKRLLQKTPTSERIRRNTSFKKTVNKHHLTNSTKVFAKFFNMDLRKS